MRAGTVAIIGAPLDLGAGRRGVDMGPSAIRVAGIHASLAALGYKVEDLGNVAVEQAESLPAGPRRTRYLPQISAACRKLAEMVEKTAGQGNAPLVLGGDHSVAVGTISGMSKHFRKTGRKLGLIWIDAHADMNTPRSSPSGNVHGMPLACVVGKGPRQLTHIFGYAPKIKPENVALVGIRDVDVLERPAVKRSGVHAFTMRDIDERGMREVIQQAIQSAASGTDGVHLSLDLDVVDPEEAPGVGTPVRGGISYREAHLAMEILCDARCLVSLEVVEVNPVIDVANKTALLAVGLASSAMGKRIL
jgi:arginase